MANAGNYAFNLLMAFLPGWRSYGALAALLALVLVGSVPGLALQAVVARHDPGQGAAWPGAGWLVGRAGIGLVVLTVILGPGLVLFLHLDSAVPVLWLALALAPTPLLFAVQGLLQGRERFGALAAVMVAGAAVKLAAGLALVAAGLGVSGAMAGSRPAASSPPSAASAWPPLSPGDGCGQPDAPGSPVGYAPHRGLRFRRVRLRHRWIRRHPGRAAATRVAAGWWREAGDGDDGAARAVPAGQCGRAAGPPLSGPAAAGATRWGGGGQDRLLGAAVRGHGDLSLAGQRPTRGAWWPGRPW